MLDAGAQADADMVEIQLGHLCNNRCVFCSSGQATALGRARPVPVEPIIAALDRAKTSGARKVTFLGGEPTLQRALIPALAHAQRLGFDEIEIFTNGVKAARGSYVDEVAALGPLSWRFSIQGGTRDAHDAAVCRPGAFDRIVRAMDHVRRHGHRITANACINERSYRSLPEYPTLVRRHGIAQLHLDVVRPASAGDRTDAYLGDIIPPHSVLAPYFARMLERFDAELPGFDVNIGNVPYCVLPQHADRIHHGGMATLTLASNLEGTLQPKDKYAFQAEDKVHGPRCDACVFRAQCGGVFAAYVRVHGTDELQPVTPADLRVRDPQQRAFVGHVEDDLHRLLQPPPVPWRTREVFRSTRDRLAVIRWSTEPSGPQLHLTLRPGSDETPGAVIVAPHTRGFVHADPGVELAALPAFIAWLRAQWPDAIESDAAIAAACLPAERLARARAEIRRGVAKLRQASTLPGGWQFDGSHPDPRWPGATVSWHRGGARVLCSLRAHMRPDGPPVEVRFSTRGPLGDEERQRCTSAVRRALAGHVPS